MPFGVRLITAPAAEPVSLDTAFRARLRLDGADDDDDIALMVKAARRLVEAETHRALITQTWSLFLDGFPDDNGEILIPRAPLSSVTWIKYYDTDGNLQTLSSANYHVATAAEPGRIWPTYNAVWPATHYGRPESVEVRFIAGYGSSATDVPEEAREAIRAIVAHTYRYRGDDGELAIPARARRMMDSLQYGEQW